MKQKALCDLCVLRGPCESPYFEIVSLACAKEISHQDHEGYKEHQARFPHLGITTACRTTRTSGIAFYGSSSKDASQMSASVVCMLK
jgi:hypothetical protein